MYSRRDFHYFFPSKWIQTLVRLHLGKKSDQLPQWYSNRDKNDTKFYILLDNRCLSIEINSELYRPE